MARPHEADAAFYDNEQYKSPETSPPGMQDSEYYPNPVNLRHMVRIPAERPEAVRLDLLGPRQFTQLCNKVIRYTLDSNKVSLLDRQFHAKLFDQNNLIQRLFIAWADRRFSTTPSIPPGGNSLNTPRTSRRFPGRNLTATMPDAS